MGDVDGRDHEDTDRCDRENADEDAATEDGIAPPDDRIVTAEDLPRETVARADSESRRAKPGDATGSQQLEWSLHEVPPGERPVAF